MKKIEADYLCEKAINKKQASNDIITEQEFHITWKEFSEYFRNKNNGKNDNG